MTHFLLLLLLLLHNLFFFFEISVIFSYERFGSSPVSVQPTYSEWRMTSWFETLKPWSRGNEERVLERRLPCFHLHYCCCLSHYFQPDLALTLYPCVILRRVYSSDTWIFHKFINLSKSIREVNIWTISLKTTYQIYHIVNYLWRMRLFCEIRLLLRVETLYINIYIYI